MAATAESRSYGRSMAKAPTAARLRVSQRRALFDSEGNGPFQGHATPTRPSGHMQRQRVLQDSNFSGFCEALAVGSLQDASISVTLAQPEDAQRRSAK